MAAVAAHCVAAARFCCRCCGARRCAAAMSATTRTSSRATHAQIGVDDASQRIESRHRRRRARHADVAEHGGVRQSHQRVLSPRHASASPTRSCRRGPCAVPTASCPRRGRRAWRRRASTGAAPCRLRSGVGRAHSGVDGSPATQRVATQLAVISSATRPLTPSAASTRRCAPHATDVSRANRSARTWHRYGGVASRLRGVVAVRASIDVSEPAL